MFKYLQVDKSFLIVVKSNSALWEIKKLNKVMRNNIVFCNMNHNKCVTMSHPY